MEEMIRVKNVSYDRYEELLMRRDAVKKEAFQYERAYIREFGDLILEVFQMKLECIRKKKTIEYCQAAVNHGKTVDQSQLQEYLKKELAAFQKQLDKMITDTENAKTGGKITESDLLLLKKIYHRLVKKMHPDINPKVAESEKLRELWQRVITAYNCNDLIMMQETEVLITKALAQMGNETMDIEIPDIEDKISELEEEITRIRETDPYQYIVLLSNPEAISEKKNSLKEEKKSYEEYGDQLEKILDDFLQDGVSFTWRMN